MIAPRLRHCSPCMHSTCYCITLSHTQPWCQGLHRCLESSAVRLRGTKLRCWIWHVSTIWLLQHPFRVELSSRQAIMVSMMLARSGSTMVQMSCCQDRTRHAHPSSHARFVILGWRHVICRWATRLLMTRLGMTAVLSSGWPVTGELPCWCSHHCSAVFS